MYNLCSGWVVRSTSEATESNNVSFVLDVKMRREHLNLPRDERSKESSLRVPRLATSPALIHVIVLHILESSEETPACGGVLWKSS